MTLPPARDPRLPRPREPFGIRRTPSDREQLARRVAADRRAPYGYESNRRNLTWLSGALAAWVILALLTAWHDKNTADMLETWQARGFATVPPGQATLDELVDFAQANGIACNSTLEIASATPECNRMIEFAAAINNADSTSSILFVGQLLAFIVLLFLVGGFVHRASRNLRTLKSEGQMFTPNWSVGWLFIPIVNLWQPMQVFGEMWRGSDPKAPVDDPAAWQRGPRSPLVSFWWLTVVASLLLSPPIITRALASADIQSRVDTANFMVWSDILMVLPAIVGLILFRAIHARQEARFALVGPNQVLPISAEEAAAARRKGKRRV